MNCQLLYVISCEKKEHVLKGVEEDRSAHSSNRCTWIYYIWDRGLQISLNRNIDVRPASPPQARWRDENFPPTGPENLPTLYIIIQKTYQLSRMIIIYYHHIWSSYIIIIYCHHILSSYIVIMYYHHIWSSYIIIIYYHHMLSSYIIIICYHHILPSYIIII